MLDREESAKEVELTVFYHGVTPSGKALKYTLDGNQRRMKFLPLSQILDRYPHPQDSLRIVIRIPEWLATKEGLT
jgi:hypothetical protein